jgi:trehalose/maltose hydrolase-like predicted phosphorylase
MASLFLKNAFVYKAEVEFPGEIRLVSIVDADVRNFGDENDPRVGKTPERLLDLISITSDADRVYCLMRTNTTKIDQATVVNYHIDAENYEMAQKSSALSITTEIESRNHIILEKHCFFTDGLRSADPFAEAQQLADRLHFRPDGGTFAG